MVDNEEETRVRIVVEGRRGTGPDSMDSKSIDSLDGLTRSPVLSPGGKDRRSSDLAPPALSNVCTVA
jgi:hypothetical protein